MKALTLGIRAALLLLPLTAQAQEFVCPRDATAMVVIPLHPAAKGVTELRGPMGDSAYFSGDAVAARDVLLDVSMKHGIVRVCLTRAKSADAFVSNILLLGTKEVVPAAKVGS